VSSFTSMLDNLVARTRLPISVWIDDCDHLHVAARNTHYVYKTVSGATRHYTSIRACLERAEQCERKARV